jgi:DNA-binding transcriptional MerR regulator
MKEYLQLPRRLTRLKPASTRNNSLSKRLYTVLELIDLTGMTRKQVAYWAQIKLLNPTLRDSQARTGRPALFYSAKEVVKAMVICDIRNAGFSLRQVQQVAQNLEEHGIRLDESEDYLVTDGNSVYYADSDTEAFDILKHYRQMLMLVPIHEQVQKLRNAA